MEQSYTQTDLIRFIYNEVDVCEFFEMDYAITHDRNLKESYKELKETVEALPKIRLNPSATTVENILSYNKESVVRSFV